MRPARLTSVGEMELTATNSAISDLPIPGNCPFHLRYWKLNS
jgi:hypothetical protein